MNQARVSNQDENEPPLRDELMLNLDPLLRSALQWYRKNRAELRMVIMKETIDFYKIYKRRDCRWHPVIEDRGGWDFPYEVSGTDTTIGTLEDDRPMVRVDWKMTGLMPTSDPARKVKWIWTDTWYSHMPPSSYMLRVGKFQFLEIEDVKVRFMRIHDLSKTYENLAKSIRVIMSEVVNAINPEIMGSIPEGRPFTLGLNNPKECKIREEYKSFRRQRGKSSSLVADESTSIESEDF